MRSLSKMGSISGLFKWGMFGLGFVALVTGCGTPGKKMPVSEVDATVGPNNVQEIPLQVESFYFKPNRIQVEVNVPVRLILKSDTFIIPHNFSLHAPEAGIDVVQDVGHGQKKIVEFTPTKVGEYQFYCDKGSHMKKGMVGTLVVVAQAQETSNSQTQ